ncbi:MAG: hypothetical protein A2458_02940 [Candidatus Kerfeldbacteria bacterium RIFOXYC2_FULL_38_9]|uniref:Magnesium transporter CorA n=1 Tax=Candidatus Kerfeldbacteria bacterium RIFOXYB2_FULL_38_14 TaxID=1798547 RepID=A0A1G2BGF2_9BACT|nr:MAG: hypothetical protein A2319_01760 [Candidatus Kerfeldbacteria bacterium RIFOXYB2_FULL_38_14]OGY88413.1 MAG: hypothetical protein A2458_02940 [Candidatus Kerfeldbacteria bacterium RIFOXYC2_FULL_38_9]
MSYTTILGNKKSWQWLNVIKPDQKDHQTLSKKFQFTADDLDDAFKSTLRSKIVNRGKYIFFVALVPFYDQKTNKVNVSEIDIFMGDDFLITISNGKIEALKTIFAKYQAVKFYSSIKQVDELFFKIIDTILENIYPLIDTINDTLEKIKQHIFAGNNARATSHNILITRRNITDMRKALRGYGALLNNLTRYAQTSNYAFSPDLKKFEELAEDAQEIWAVLESHKEMVEALKDSNESLISHNLNAVMKTLTIFSVILLPAGVVAGIFGMNAENIPVIGKPLDFWILLGIICSVSLFLLFIFWRKRWLR